jgi:ABC-type microcin C transport system permease subunit YejB
MALLDGKATRIIGASVALIVGLSLVGAFAATMFGEVEDINTAFTANTTGDATADTIASIFPLVIGAAFILGLAGLVLSLVAFGKK